MLICLQSQTKEWLSMWLLILKISLFFVSVILKPGVYTEVDGVFVI